MLRSSFGKNGIAAMRLQRRMLSSEPVSQTLTSWHNETRKPGDLDQALRDNIKSMGSILGNAVKAQDPQVFESVEKLRRLGREVRRSSMPPIESCLADHACI
jgi:hypothetical protein